MVNCVSSTVTAAKALSSGNRKFVALAVDFSGLKKVARETGNAVNELNGDTAVVFSNAPLSERFPHAVHLSVFAVGVAAAVVVAPVSEGAAVTENVESAVSFGPNLFGSDTKTRAGFDHIRPRDGFFDVGIHGSPDSFFVIHNGEVVALDHRTLATFIKKNGWNGDYIRLISCSTGASPTCIAQNLANKLGTVVIAPSDTLWSLMNGDLVIGPKPWSNTGHWKTFFPGAIQK